MTPRAKSFFLLAGVLLVVGSLAQNTATRDLEQRIGGEKRELQRMRQELEAGKRRVRELQRQAADATQGLQQVRANLQLQQNLLARLDSTQGLYEELVARSRREQSLAETAWRHRQAALAARVREMYMRGRPRPARAWILGARRDPSAWVGALAQFRRLVRSDEALLHSVRDRAEAARRQERLHRERVAGLQQVESEKRAQVAQLDQERGQREKDLATLQDRESLERKRLADLEASQAALQTLLRTLEARRRELEAERLAEEKRRRDEEAALERQRREAERQRRANPSSAPAPAVPAPRPRPQPAPAAPVVSGPAPARRGLCWPVKGAILSRFGLQKNAVLGTVTRNLGVEIQGRAGQGVVAAAKGQVAAVTRLPGRGNTVVLEHAGGYFSIYGQLQRITVAPGAKVDACSELGTLEDGTPPRVYFEYRHNLNAEDPLEWLTR